MRATDQRPSRSVAARVVLAAAGLLALGVQPVGTTEWFNEQPGAIFPWATASASGPAPEIVANAGEINLENVAALQPDLIFADERTGNLDSRAGAEILGVMRRAVDEFRQTIVMVTHDSIAAAYADRVVFLADGKIVDEMLEPTSERVLDRLKNFGD